MQKKNLYRLHRVLSTLIGIPVFLWAVSGLMHPLMTSVRPAIYTQASPRFQLPPAILQKAAPLKSVLQAAGISQASQVHLIHMDTSWYYQVLTTPADIPRYFHLLSGHENRDADRQYAGELARHFLEGDSNVTTHTPVESITRLTKFTRQYSYVNRFLPVYKVAFGRGDQIAIYVDTHNSRFAFALDHHRAVFNAFFGWFHTWSWMDSLPRLKAAIIALILLLTLLTGSIGIYLAFTTKSGRHRTNPLVRARRLHRITAITGAFFLMAWAFSGTIHALQNARPPFKIQSVSPAKISSADIAPCVPANAALLAEAQPLAGLNLFKLRGHLWIQAIPYNRQSGVKDLMKAQSVKDQPLLYYETTDSSLIAFNEKQAVAILAETALKNRFHLKTAPGSLQLQYLTHFTESYNFSDKILPVWQVSYGQGINRTMFLDASTGEIVKKGDAYKQADALIFAFFHKHEFMSWAGKSAKDMSTIIGILILLSLLIVGYRLLYIRSGYRKKREK